MLEYFTFPELEGDKFENCEQRGTPPHYINIVHDVLSDR
jgi:hypothetical protein